MTTMIEFCWEDEEEYGDSYIIVEITENGLLWTGDSGNPNHGGGYTIGFQSFEAFFRGERPREIPQEVEAEMRRYLEQRASLKQAQLRLLVRAEVTAAYHQISVGLDGVNLKLLHEPALQAGEALELFMGSLAPGAHKLSAAVVWDEHSRRVYPKLELEISEGELGEVWLKISEDDAAFLRMTSRS